MDVNHLYIMADFYHNVKLGNNKFIIDVPEGTTYKELIKAISDMRKAGYSCFCKDYADDIIIVRRMHNK